MTTVMAHQRINTLNFNFMDYGTTDQVAINLLTNFRFIAGGLQNTITEYLTQEFEAGYYEVAPKIRLIFNRFVFEPSQ